MTGYYKEQGNLYMQNMNSASIPPPRFEHMGHPADHPGGQDSHAPQEQAPPVFAPMGRQQVHKHDPEPESDLSEPRPEHSHSRAGSGRPQGRNFLGIENDKLLLMALIYLLIKENADIKLIAALGYLLL